MPVLKVYKNGVWEEVGISQLKNPNALTINGTAYDGSTSVNMTDIINNMIAAKLEEITKAEEVAF